MRAQLAANLFWIPLLPLIGFAVNGLFGHRLRRVGVGLIASAAVGGSLLYSLACLGYLWRHPDEVLQFETLWFAVGGLAVNFTLVVDTLSALMIAVVTLIGFLIHLYSIGYMDHDRSPWRFFAYLNLFCAAMLCLVLGGDLVLLFLGWEGVGLCSYLLIGYWYRDPANCDAGKKAFIVNRIGDFGFLLGMFLLIQHFGTLNVAQLKAMIAAGDFPAGEYALGLGLLSVIGILLFIGACGKSAQIPLYVWLPDAMAGPTPVSALIHAATMVTAGVYMVARMHFLYDLAPEAQSLVLIIGTATALWAGLIGVTQNDIKKVLAYSTVSQLGFMFMAMGAGAYAAGIFHVFTHAFFKACLFLGSGVLIYANHHEQDMRRYGGLRRMMPAAFACYLAGSLALAGVPLFSGFFSKDEILWLVRNREVFWGAQGPNAGLYFWLVGAGAALLTALYTGRMLALSFGGTFRGQLPAKHAGHPAEASSPPIGQGHGQADTDDTGEPYRYTEHGLIRVPRIMIFVIAVLALGSVLVGYLGVPQGMGGGNHFEHFLSHSVGEAPHPTHHEGSPSEGMAIAVSIVIALIGLFLGYSQFVKPGAGFFTQWAQTGAGRWAHRISLNKFYVDELYHALFVVPLRAISKLLYWVVDGGLIDGALHATVFVSRRIGGSLRALHAGEVNYYTLSILSGTAVILGWLGIDALRGFFS